MSTHFTIIDLAQGTQEWLQWRHGGIGASEASVILGENRFQRVDELLNYKRGPLTEFAPNAAMALGTKLEPEARKRYIARQGRDYRPVCLQSTRYEWLRASLDGLAITDDAVVEIKCGQSVYRWTSRSGSVPSYYIGQLQHILAVTNLQEIDFWCHWPGCPDLLISTKRDDKYIERMLRMEMEFWNAVISP
jgi:putative phage-type endonuclease